MKKKCILLLCAVSALGGYAQETEWTIVTNGVKFVVTGEKTVGLKGLFEENKTKTLVVPATVKSEGVTYTVTSVESEALKWTELESVELPESVTVLKESAIYSNAYLKTVKLPAGLKTLEPYALASNEALNNLVIPAGVTEIPANCFFSNKSLTNLTIEGKYTSIGDGAFYKVPLTEIVIPESCKSIGDNAFQLCPELKKVTLPEGLERLEEGAFRQCRELTEVNLPSTLESIGEYAFLETALADVTIPAAVESIGSGAFAGTKIKAFSVAEGNKKYKALDGVLYTADGRVLTAYPTLGAEEYTVADGCLGIDAGAFESAVVKKVTLPETVRVLNDNAFSLSALAEINVPSSLRYFGSEVFAGTQLTSFTIPEGLTEVSVAMFAQCPELRSVTLPSTIDKVNSLAFVQCKSLTEIHCLGVRPPVLDYFDDYEHPFASVDPSKVTVSVPAGRLTEYKESDWGSKFTNFVDKEKGAFAYVSVTPANDSELEKIEAIEFVFPEAATVVKDAPTVEISEGMPFYGNEVKVNGWKAAVKAGNATTVVVTPSAPVALEEGHVYFVKLPAGFVKNAAGLLNEPVMLELSGTGSASIEIVESANRCVTTFDGNFEVILSEVSDVEMYNASGMLLSRKVNADGVVTFTPQGRGLYIIRVVNSDKVETFKMMH